MSLRPDLALIAAAIPSGARVLDVGCGEGTLLLALGSARGVRGHGLEIDAARVSAALARGLAVVQGDAETDLVEYPDRAFDYAVLSQTIQAMRRPAAVLAELARVAERAFVSFPNFGHWRVRASLALGGRMPVTRALPLSWHDTPNIHLCTIRDFAGLADASGLIVERWWPLAHGLPRPRLGANLLAEQAVFLLRRR